MSMNWIQLLSGNRSGESNDEKSSFNENRSAFEQDYDRIIFSQPFRKLQDKTQVFPLPEQDFVHTRLTHSLEVASVGRSLGKKVGKIILERNPLSTKYGRPWNLDLPSIAGIMAVIGTGVDHQIVILDEARKTTSSIKERMKRAFFIIFGAFTTTLFAMLPLLFAGAGLLRGFALATVVGLLVSVFITRPAFADIIKQLS